MLQSHTTLRTINEENESEISSVIPTIRENKRENGEKKSSINVSQTQLMNSEIFSVDTDSSSYKCFKKIALSSSSLSLHPLYYFPYLEDPGIQKSLETPEKERIYKNDCQIYKDICENLGIYPISRVCKSLESKELNLKYYVPSEEQMKAICKVLEMNKFIEILDLRYNWLSVESCTYLGSVLEINTTLKVLKMKECRIGDQGMAAIAEVQTFNSIRELDLSYNSLGDEGLEVGKNILSSNLTTLNLSHNELTEEAAYSMCYILKESQILLDLDLSWNTFNSPKSAKILCEGLLENESLQRLNLAWNGISSPETMDHFVNYLKNNHSIKFLDLSNNLIGGPSLDILMEGVYASPTLEHLKIGNNVFSPQQAYFSAELLSKRRKQPLKLIDMENMVVYKKFLSLLEKIRKQGKNVIHGVVLANYEINGPYIPKVLFGRCRYLVMKHHKKRHKDLFGHFILSLPKRDITTQEFQAALAAKKLKKILNKSLIKAVQQQYLIQKTGKINCSQLVDDYMLLFPETKPKLRKHSKKRKKQKKRTKIANKKRVKKYSRKKKGTLSKKKHHVTQKKRKKKKIVGKELNKKKENITTLNASEVFIMESTKNL